MYSVLYLLLLLFLTIQVICYYKNISFYELVKPTHFATKFNEANFKCIENCHLYHQQVINGYQNMKNIDCIITGLVKDSENTLPLFIQRITHLQPFFKSLIVVLFENDSSDNTRNILLKWEKSNKNVHIIKCNDPSIQHIIPSNSPQCSLKLTPAISDGPFSKSRFSKMVKFRNILLHKSKEFVTRPNNTYLIMIDTDLKGGFSIDGIAHSFGQDTEWDMISSYGLTSIALTLGKTFYYDLMAYKDQNTTGIPTKLKQMFKVHKTVNNKARGSKLIPVQSSFAGFAIYKHNSIKNTDYSGDNLCEHINLHDNMRKQGYDKLYINPNMIVLPGLQSFYEKYPFLY